MRAKCRICKASLDTNTAYLVITKDSKGKDKKAYYCNEAEYKVEEQRKEKAYTDKDKAYRCICNIIGREEIINSSLWKEWAVWNKVATDEVIGKYLEANIYYLKDVISKLDDVEYNRIRYLSAILKNKLGDFKPKEKAKEIEKPKVKVEETFYQTSTTRNNKRRSLADLEDEF